MLTLISTVCTLIIILSLCRQFVKKHFSIFLLAFSVISLITTFFLSIKGIGAISLTLLGSWGFWRAAKQRLETAGQRKMYQDFLGLIPLVSSSLQAGMNLPDSLQLAAANGDGPMVQQIRQSISRYHFGQPFTRCLNDLKSNVADQNLKLAFQAMSLNYRRGGNLISALASIQASMNNHLKIKGKLQALTAQARTQAYLLCAAPGLFLLLLFFWDPNKLELLTQTLQGQILLGTAFFLEICGIALTKRIMKLDI